MCWWWDVDVAVLNKVDYLGFLRLALLERHRIKDHPPPQYEEVGSSSE